MKAVVTGAGGFIGAALTSRLLAAGWEVTGLDLPPALPRIPAGARRIGLDIRAGTGLHDALRGAQVLFHTAALFDLAAPWSDLRATNVLGMRHVCTAARECRVERTVVWSSSSVYGGTRRPVALNEDAEVPIRRLNDYAQSKYLGELAARAEVARGLEVIVLRPAEVYGPGSINGLALALFAFKTGAMNAVPGPGQVRHSYVHVEDVTRAAVHVVERGVSGEVYNVSGRTTLVAADLYAMARRRLGAVSLREGRVTLPDRPRLWGRPLLHVPAGILWVYAQWELLRARHGWLVRRFGGRPLATPAAVRLLLRNHVVDASRLYRTGFEPSWPDATAGILETLETYERSDWASLRTATNVDRAAAVPTPARR